MKWNNELDYKLKELINLGKDYNEINKETISIEKIPIPIFNIINGGKHANNSLDFQEYQIIPSSSQSFSE